MKSLGDQEVVTSISDKSSGINPVNYNLYQNYPNPFNPGTTIKYDLKKNENVVLDIYSISGERVARLVDQQQNSGTHEIRWNGRNDNGSLVSSGIYFYQLRIGNQYLTKKMMMLK
ncbi:MAG: T9SS type A sorting domain-containing protein [Ignavibacteria bacterium]